MTLPPPVVRYFILCNDLAIDPSRDNSVSLVDVVYSIRSEDEPPFPAVQSQLCAFVVLANGRGSGEIRLRIVFADTGEEVLRTALYHVDFGVDPLRVFGLPIRLRNCVFSKPGLYWVEIDYNGTMIAQQDLLLR